MVKKHRKNCECCPRHSLFKGHNVIVNIVVLNCQKCNQCHKCQVSGHKFLGLLWNCSENLKFFQSSETFLKIRFVFENGQVMSPCHSDNMSQGSRVSGIVWGQLEKPWHQTSAVKATYPRFKNYIKWWNCQRQSRHMHSVKIILQHIILVV